MFIFEVFGPLVPQKQTRCACRNGLPHMWNPSKKEEEQLKWQVRPFAPSTPICEPVELTLAFFFPVLKGTSKAVRTQMINRVILPDKKPDFDNLAYFVTNALKGIVYDDDKRVCVSHIYKFYGEQEKTVIKVRPILQAQPLGYRDADDL